MKYIFTLLLLTVFLTGCAQSEVSSEQEVIKIGVLTPLTGWAAFWGEGVQEGIDLAVGEINAKGGIDGKKIKIIYEDSKGTEDLFHATTAAQKLVTVDKVDILLTTFLEDTIVATPFASEADIPILSIAAGNTGFDDASNLFRIRPYKEGMLPEATFNHFTTNSVAVLYTQIPFYENVKDEVITSGKNNNVSVESISVTADVRSEILKLNKEKFDVVIASVTNPSQIDVMKRVKEVNLNIPIVGVGEIDSAYLDAGSATDGLYLWVYEDLSSINFDEAFKEKYDKLPSGEWNSLSYDSIYAIYYGYEESKNLLEGMKGVSFEGASGFVSFNTNQNRFVDFENLNLYQKINGTFVRVE